MVVKFSLVRDPPFNFRPYFEQITLRVFYWEELPFKNTFALRQLFQGFSFKRIFHYSFLFYLTLATQYGIVLINKMTALFVSIIFFKFRQYTQNNVVLLVLLSIQTLMTTHIKDKNIPKAGCWTNMVSNVVLLIDCLVTHCLLAILQKVC